MLFHTLNGMKTTNNYKCIEENVQSNIPKEVLRMINLIKNKYFRHLKTYKIELV